METTDATQASGSQRIQMVFPLPGLVTAGQQVELRIDDGTWVGGFRTTSGVTLGEEGPEIRVSREDEWQAAQCEHRPVADAPWPHDQIRPVSLAE